MISVWIAGCSVPSPTSTPTPVLTALPVPTLPANAIPYAITPDQSLIHYLATGVLNTQYPGTFKVTGQTIAFVPENDGYRVNIEITFDLKSATATDSFMRNTLLGSLDADHYPIATLSLASQDVIRVQPESDSIPAMTFPTHGTFTLHGRQLAVDMPITLSASSGTLQASGSLIYKLSDYDVHISGFVVNDTITFTANLMAARR